MFDRQIPYVETVRRSKWSSREINRTVMIKSGDTILIDRGFNLTLNELLDRSLVVNFLTSGSEMPILSKVRR